MNISSGIKGSCLFNHVPKLNVANCPSVKFLSERNCKITTVALDLMLNPGLLQPASARCAKNMTWGKLSNWHKDWGHFSSPPQKGKSFGFGNRWKKGLARVLKVSLCLRLLRMKIFIGDGKDIVSLNNYFFLSLFPLSPFSYVILAYMLRTILYAVCI